MGDNDSKYYQSVLRYMGASWEVTHIPSKRSLLCPKCGVRGSIKDKDPIVKQEMVCAECEACGQISLIKAVITDENLEVSKLEKTQRALLDLVEAVEEFLRMLDKKGLPYAYHSLNHVRVLMQKYKEAKS